MATSIRLNNGFVSEVKSHVLTFSRSVPKQIEHWAKIGRMAEENPDLPYAFILDSLLAKNEVDNGKVLQYVRRTKSQKINVYETRRFTKALSKLPDQLLSLVEDEIQKILNKPKIGEQKRGDLSFLRVHKT
uniref:ParD-like antitoxin of type II toxin-antitoxin system n=1 Tax=Arsenophonus endosymbiont of Trialeurodes vaporariorum TaxID=235567 RepID=A0A3B0M257_9GAMM